SPPPWSRAGWYSAIVSGAIRDLPGALACRVLSLCYARSSLVGLGFVHVGILRRTRRPFGCGGLALALADRLDFHRHGLGRVRCVGRRDDEISLFLGAQRLAGTDAQDDEGDQQDMG